MSKKLTVLAVLSMALMTGCNDSNNVKKKPKVNSISEAEKLEIQGKAAEASEMYSRMSEILLSKPQGIVHAHKMFDKALELNSSNNRANIYSAMISPALKAKGFAVRFKEIADRKTENADKLKKLEQKVQTSQVEEYINFATKMNDGDKEVKNYDDVRKFIRNEYAAELKKSIAKLENVKTNTVLSIDFTAYLSKSLAQSSEVVSYSEENIAKLVATKVSDEKSEKRITIDTHDIKALKIILKTQRSALLVATSIGLNGLEGLEAKAKKGKLKTDKHIVHAIAANPSFLKIEGEKDDLREIFDHSEDVMNDLIDFSKISNEVCGNPDRKNNIALNICVTEEAADKIEEVLTFVVGPRSVLLGLDEYGDEVLVDVDVRALLNSKVSSLQELLPSKFDDAGKAIDLKDKTFNGIIPNADLLDKMKTVVK